MPTAPGSPARRGVYIYIYRLAHMLQEHGAGTLREQFGLLWEADCSKQCGNNCKAADVDNEIGFKM